ncbi:MAG: hypothetical protein KDK50_06800, partial [Chlamydiia bacterium]|nr:hypothetical protein [Chlamydiia bacterium]
MTKVDTNTNNFAPSAPSRHELENPSLTRFFPHAVEMKKTSNGKEDVASVKLGNSYGSISPGNNLRDRLFNFPSRAKTLISTCSTSDEAFKLLQPEFESIRKLGSSLFSLISDATLKNLLDNAFGGKLDTANEIFQHLSQTRWKHNEPNLCVSFLNCLGSLLDDGSLKDVLKAISKEKQLFRFFGFRSNQYKMISNKQQAIEALNSLLVLSKRTNLSEDVMLGIIAQLGSMTYGYEIADETSSSIPLIEGRKLLAAMLKNDPTNKQV